MTPYKDLADKSASVGQQMIHLFPSLLSLLLFKEGASTFGLQAVLINSQCPWTPNFSTSEKNRPLAD